MHPQACLRRRTDSIYSRLVGQARTVRRKKPRTGQKCFKDRARYISVLEPGHGIFARRRYVCGPEQCIKNREKCAKIPVAMLWLCGIMDSVKLRRIQQKPHSAKTQPNVHVEDIVPYADKPIDSKYRRAGAKEQSDGQIDREGLDRWLNPKVARRRRRIHGRIAMVK